MRKQKKLEILIFTFKKTGWFKLDTFLKLKNFLTSDSFESSIFSTLKLCMELSYFVWKFPFECKNHNDLF